MAVSRAAASRMAITRISVGIRSRYAIPLPTEVSLKTLPRAVAMAICAEGSVGSGAVAGLSRISSIDGSWRNSRRKATSSEAAAGPTVPSRSCASNSLVPDRSCVFWRRAIPHSTCEAISQERGVGHALASDGCIGRMQKFRLEAQEGDDLGTDLRLHRPSAPVVEIRFKVQMHEPVAQRSRHREMNSTLRCRIAGGDDHPAVGQHILAELSVEHELIAARLGHLRRRGQLIEKENALAGRREETSEAPILSGLSEIRGRPRRSTGSSCTARTSRKS